MNLTTHEVTPEEIMAWLDGELSNAEAHAVAAHVDDCVECADLATQFRGTTHFLSTWTVPPVSSALEDSFNGLTGNATSEPNTIKPGGYVDLNLRKWNPWAIGGASAVAAVLILLAATSAIWFHPVQEAKEARVMTYLTTSEASQPIQQQGSRASMAPPRIANSLDAPAPASQIAGGGGGGAPAADASVSFHGNTKPDANPSAPMVARTTSLTILVKDIAAARASLDVIVAQHRGYSSQITVDLSDSSPPRGIMASLRVPASEMPSALVGLRALGRVEREKQSGEEVTQQHTDLVARLQNSRETEQRLRDILAQRTGKIEDVLQVEEEIARVRGEIESMEADQKALEHRVDFATIDLELVEEYKAQFNLPDTSASTRMHNAFVAGIHNASDTLLGIVLFFEEYGPVLLIWIVILGVPAILVWRKYRKVRSRI